MELDRKHIAMKVSWISIVGNVLLCVFKLFAGFFANSSAMISDAIHTLSDVLSTFIVIVGIKLSNQDSDKKHQYGHERFECVAAIVLAAILGITGIGIGYSGVEKIIFGNKEQLAVPGMLALIAAIVSIAIKETMYWYTRAAAKRINSGALMADAWHHRSDALSSVGSLIGIAGARLGFPIMDPIASVVICIFIFKAAVSIFMDAVGKMTDKACEQSTIEKMRKIITAQEGVLGIAELKTRLFGDKVYVDVEIFADGKDSLSSTHEIAHKIHDEIESHFPNVKHCMVHVNPADQIDKTINI